jgi:hypothetical protein
MSVTCHYVHIGDGTVVEFVTTYAGGDTDIWVNVLPPESAPVDEPPLAPEPDEVGPELTLAAAPAEKSRRSLKAFIRGAWTFAIAMFVEGGSYLVSNMTSVHIPAGVGLAAGAVLQGAIYGAKKYVKPDGLL